MKIYTRSGDEGKTGLLGSVRVPKSHLAIEVCGSIDEANCHLGCVVATWPGGTATNSSLESSVDSVAILIRIQNELFDLGSRVAASLATETKTQPAVLDEASVRQLEDWIDQFDALLQPLTTFILPGGSPTGGQLHLARTVCRRAERRMVQLIDSSPQRDLSMELKYLNRLSDLLFVMARFVNQQSKCPETPWLAQRREA